MIAKVLKITRVDEIIGIYPTGFEAAE